VSAYEHEWGTWIVEPALPARLNYALN
jgi:hypothetical protein